ncbi:peptidase S8/S53 domain-containing protein [Lactarius vividus]|nr:peptidase S8/S53 domain-containing protein [Lactarius vividus]
MGNSPTSTIPVELPTLNFIRATQVDEDDARASQERCVNVGHLGPRMTVTCIRSTSTQRGTAQGAGLNQRTMSGPQRSPLGIRATDRQGERWPGTVKCVTSLRLEQVVELGGHWLQKDGPEDIDPDLTLFSILTSNTVTSRSTCVQPWHDISVKHAWNAVPDNWECLGPPPTGITIDLHIALQPQEENVLMEALYEVSTPSRPKYGRHLSKEEVAKLVKPHPDTLELVHSWLAYHDVHSSSISTSHGGGCLTVTDVPVSQANELLGASYQLYRLAGTNDTAILRTLTPHGHSARAAEARIGAVEPPTALTKNAIGILGYGNEFPSPIDLDIFMTVFRHDSDLDDATFTVELVNGGQYDPSWPGMEANLDMQYAQAIAYPTPHIFYSIGGKITWSLDDYKPIAGDFFLMWMAYLIPKEKIPQTMSASYGLKEKDAPAEYARSVCDLFMQLGACGVSIIFASGDDGVGAGNCQDASGKTQFIHMFPATSRKSRHKSLTCVTTVSQVPTVTSIGGTMSSNPEVAAGLSGGGFSNYFGRPAYQNVVVPAFLQSLGSQYDGMYNPGGRGVPDVSAQALHFVVIHHTNSSHTSGTSCAAPTVAGIIAMLNDFLISEGKDPLGFLNPWLYTKEEGMFGLNDIRSGSNPGCDTGGFTAIPGWDPVTGLGTPDFSELLHVLRTRTGAGNQRRIFPDLFNKSDSATTRDAKFGHSSRPH